MKKTTIPIAIAAFLALVLSMAVLISSTPVAQEAGKGVTPSKTSAQIVQPSRDKNSPRNQAAAGDVSLPTVAGGLSESSRLGIFFPLFDCGVRQPKKKTSEV